MSNADWERLQTLFEEVMALPAAERNAYLNRACAGDDALRAEIDALIIADKLNRSEVQAPDYLDAVADPDNELVGTTVDDWHIIERVGAGGMGSVFLAERAGGEFEQRAALKIVKKGMDTEVVLQRFRQERQILARLNHPNIARLLGGGMTPDGRPYFAMEYVDGLPITEYCDQHRLSLQDRLALFRKACYAVHYAHRNLVVHRDLKPSNIIVTADGELRLLDFGIAKLLGDTEQDDQLTRTGMQVLTPAYAAPEQLLNQSITTATDVYALGIVLYELLSGRKPFEVRRTLGELRDLVLTGSPPKPSVAVLQQPVDTQGRLSTKTVEEVGNARGERVDRLCKHLSGDLDTICLMAMHREPDHRYASVNQMAEDIRRHLHGEPVVASPDSALYRLGKFYKRHRPAVVSAAAVVAAFSLMILFYTIRLAEERDFALEEQQKANEVVDFVTGLFEVSDPSESRGRELTARQILDAGAERIRTELADRPAVQSTMRRVLGGVYYSLGSFTEAEALISAALEQQLALHGDSHLDVATTKLAFGILHQDRGEYDIAERYYDQALATRRALLGDSSMAVMEAISLKAYFEQTVGNMPAAESLHLEALRMGRQMFQGNHEFVAEAITNLGGLYRLLDRLDEAEPLLREALAMQQQLYGGPHPESDSTKRQLAGLLRDTRRFGESQSLYLEVIESRTQILGPDHIDVANVWNSYSQLLADMGDYDAAIEANRAFMEIFKRAYSGAHPSLGAAYNNLATMLVAVGDFEGAMENYELSIDMQDQVGLPPRHPNRAYPMSGVARMHLRQGRSAEAVAVFRDILELRLESYPPEHVLVSETKSSLGAALTALGDYEEAESLLLATYQQFLSGRGAGDPRTARTVRRLQKLYEAMGDEERASHFRALLPVDD